MFVLRFDPESKPEQPGWRRRLYEVIFETDTGWGQRFDIILLICVALSIVTIGLETVESVRTAYADELYVMEWIFTILFSLEYLLRLVCVARPARYVFSMVGIIDLVSVLPTYLAPLIGAHAGVLKVFRALRLLRVFRVFQMRAFVREGDALLYALKNSAQKITVFTVVVLLIALVAGSIMFFVEGSEPGTAFTSIPRSVYWAIVTMTTVGYGDISPQTPLGQGLASALMVIGYGVLAVPTGIVTAQMVKDEKSAKEGLACTACGSRVELEARYCGQCGAELAVGEASE